MSSYSVGITLDISDTTSATDVNIGLNSGVFYWITGRPGYTGSGYLGDAPSGKTWYEGILALNNLGQPNRIVDIITDGDYGTLSGFTFVIDNTSNFWYSIQNNLYNLKNRIVNVYIFLDDVSYQNWSGVVKDVVFDRVKYTIKCKDNFTAIHKTLPPEKITNTSFPNIDSPDEGKAFPICFGLVNRAKLYNVSMVPEAIDLAPSIPNTITSSPAKKYSYYYPTADTGTPYVDIYNPNSSFDEDVFKGKNYYLRVIKGDDQVIKIIGNDATAAGSPNSGYNYTRLYLEKSLSKSDTQFSADGNNWVPGDGELSDDVWFFQIVSMTSQYVLSLNSIEEFDQLNTDLVLKRYDANKNDYEDIEFDSIEFSNDTSSSIGYPYVNIISGNFDYEGDMVIDFPIVPDLIRYAGVTGSAGFVLVANDFADLDNIPKLTDRSRATVVQYKTTNENEVTLKLNVYIPVDKILDYDKLWLAADFYSKDSGGLYTEWDFEAYAVSWYDSQRFSTDAIPSFQYTVYDGPNYRATLPDSYYQLGGDPDLDNWPYNKWGSLWDASTLLADKHKINNTLISSYNDTLCIKYIRLTFHSDFGTSKELNVAQIGFIGQRTLNIKNDDFFVKLRGEQVDA